MAHYYCHLLDHEQRVRARETIESADNHDAVEKARRYLNQHPAIPAVEVWHEARRINVLRQTQLRNSD